MKKILVSLLILFLGFLLWTSFQKGDSKEKSAGFSPDPEPLSTAQAETLGDRVLERYASSGSSGMEDLQLFEGYVQNVFLLIKNRDTRHYSTNEDLALFLLGKNTYRTAYLSPGHPILNEKQQLVDRWNTPLKVHALSSKVLELRSAGPDQKLFTEDDLVLPH